MSSRPDCIFEIHQLWQSGFSRVYSNSYCSYSFEPEIIKNGLSSHKMYSNNILNFQESTTILNACTKKSGNLLNAPWIYSLCVSLCTHVYMYLPTYLHTYIHTYIHSNQHIFRGVGFAFLSFFLIISSLSLSFSLFLTLSLSLNVCVCVYTYVCVCLHLRILALVKGIGWI